MLWLSVPNPYPVPLCILLATGSSVLSCASDQGFGSAKFDADPGSPDIDLSIDVALQRASWGTRVGRCHIQAAIRLYEPHDEAMRPYGESNGTVLGLPDRPMTCIHTDIAEPPGPVEIGGDRDNWAIAGEGVAAERIVLSSEQRDIVLHAIELDTGAIRYQWEDCALEEFPFGEVFDLHLPDRAEAFIAGFTVESAFAVGPDFRIVEPQSDPMGIEHDQGEDLVIAWDHAEPMPRVRDLEVDIEQIVWARNRTVSDHQPFEALGCLAEGGALTIRTEDLQTLRPNPSDDELEYLLGLQIDTVVTSPAFQTPWGRTISVRSTVSDGGDLMLTSERDSGLSEEADLSSSGHRVYAPQ